MLQVYTYLEERLEELKAESVELLRMREVAEQRLIEEQAAKPISKLRRIAQEVLGARPDGLTNEQLYKEIIVRGGNTSNPNAMRSTLARYSELKRDERGRWFLGEK